jgi:hypothetical protein
MDDEDEEQYEEPSKGLSTKNKKIVAATIIVVIILILSVLFITDNASFLTGNGNGDTNHKPVANAGGDHTIYEKERAMFDGSNSTDADQDKLTYRWEFSDRVTISGKIVYRFFNVTGEYSATLVVSDGNDQGEDTFNISVIPAEPSGPPEVILFQEKILPFTPYEILITNITYQAEIAKFYIKIIKSETGDELINQSINEILDPTGDVYFVDNYPQTSLNEGDFFQITADETKLDIEDGDLFIIIYKENGSEVKVGDVELKTSSLP